MGTKNSCSIVSVAVKLSFLANLFKDLLRTNKNSKLRNIKMFSLKLTVGAAMLVVLATAGNFQQSSAHLMRRLEGSHRRQMLGFDKNCAAGQRRRMQTSAQTAGVATSAFDPTDDAGERRRLKGFTPNHEAGDRR